MALWGARFKKNLDHDVSQFNASINVDSRLYHEDIEGSMAHVAMLKAQKVIPPREADQISSELAKILNELENGKLTIDPAAEDIHMWVETELTRRLGDLGKKLHTARSRNDQTALDLRLHLRKEIDQTSSLLRKLVIVFCEKAKANLETVMPGYTHLQRAQPITFAHHLMAYVEMFLRDLGRLNDTRKRMNVSPLGNAALAGTTYDIDREFTQKRLGFDAVTQNSLDGVSDRDFAIELVSNLAMIMMHLSRLGEEVTLWASWEFKFIELDDAFATGSSIMPQKKNPDIAELVRGKTGRVYGDLVNLLTITKALPLSYNKDLQEDKAAVFDALETVAACLNMSAAMIKTLKVLPESMRMAAGRGFINATDLADYLTKKGLPFRDAYSIVGKLVATCIEQQKTLEDLTLEELKKVSDLFEDDVYIAINLDDCVKRRNIIGGPAPTTVSRRIREVEELLS